MSTQSLKIRRSLLNILGAMALCSSVFAQVSSPQGNASPDQVAGSWRDLGAGDFVANYKFTLDGAFDYAARFSPVGVTILESGKYTVNRDGLTLTPERKIYDKWGNKFEEPLVIRTYKWRVDQGPQGGRLLTLMIDGTVHRYAEQ